MTSQFRGVHLPRRQGKELRYIAKIYHEGKGRYIGAFATEVEAAVAYDRVALQLKGEDAQLNFPDGVHHCEVVDEEEDEDDRAFSYSQHHEAQRAAMEAHHMRMHMQMQMEMQMQMQMQMRHKRAGPPLMWI